MVSFSARPINDHRQANSTLRIMYPQGFMFFQTQAVGMSPHLHSLPHPPCAFGICQRCGLAGPSLGNQLLCLGDL